MAESGRFGGMPPDRSKARGKDAEGRLAWRAQDARALASAEDKVTAKNFDHRKPLVEKRILALGKIFAVGIYAYAVMSNHLHVVLTVQPDQANQWSTEEVIDRWLLLFPSTKKERREERAAELRADTVRVQLCRDRLADLSWFMRCLDEYLAKLFNKEDDCTGTCQPFSNTRRDFFY